MSHIKSANKIALQLIVINLVVAVICSFLPSFIGEVSICLITSIYAVIKANKEQIEIPLSRPRFKVILICIAITVTGFPIAFFLNYLGSCLGGAASGSELSYSLWQAILIIGIFPAITEEVTFRGLLQGAWMKESVAYSILLSSVYFAVIHTNISAVLYAFFYGCLFALIRIVTSNLAYTMIMHSVFNITNVCLYYYKGFSLSDKWMIALGVLTGLLFCIILGCFIHYNNIRFTERKRPVKDFITYEGVIALGICFSLIIMFTLLS